MKFLEKCKLPELLQKIDKLNSPISIKEIKCVVKNLSTKKTKGPNGFTSEFYRVFEEKHTNFDANWSRK